MKTRRFLSLIAVFTALFANFGTLSAQSEINLKYLQTLKGHSGYVNSVCWSPDGKYLASGSADNTVVIWDAKSGQELKTLKGHSEGVNSVYWSPDGKYLASGSNDNTVIIWDAETGQRLLTLKGHSGYVNSVCWSPDEKYLASGAFDNTVIIWDANSGQRLKTLKGHSLFVKSVCWSPDGRYLSSGAFDKTVIIWDAKSGKILKTLEGHSFGVSSVSWSHDGKYLASGSWDNTVIIWSVEDDKLSESNGVDYGGSGTSFSLAGRGAKSLGKPSSSTGKVGHVVVEIKVDKDGNVLEAKAGQRGTTLWDSNLWRVCEEAAKKCKFTANPDAPEVQNGTVTYIFR